MDDKEITVYKEELLSRTKIAIQFFVIFTWITWLFVVASFITQGKILVPAGLWSNYLIFLTAYVLTKEASRWRLHLIQTRRGDWFVYLWVCTGLTVWVLQGLGQCFDIRLSCSYELNWLVGQIVVYYAGGQYSKSAYYKKMK